MSRQQKFQIHVKERPGVINGAGSIDRYCFSLHYRLITKQEFILRLLLTSSILPGNLQHAGNFVFDSWMSDWPPDQNQLL